MIGRVVSAKMQKTAVVLIESRKTHPLYKKTYVWSKKYLADDPIGVSLGDMVDIVKVAPVSKRKHWRITKVLGKDFVALEEEKIKEVVEEAISEVMPEDQTSEVGDQSSEEKPKRTRKIKEEE